MKKKSLFICLVIFISCVFFNSCKENTKDSKVVKIGLLHSLTGTMAISEVPVLEAELLAIKEINESGGVLGKEIVFVKEDGESKPEIFAEKARKLITEDEVVSIFGCWTSDSRKAVKPVLEEHFNLLWYPVQYEGMEASPCIMYMGACPNQQVIPAIEYCKEQFGEKMFLLGSDYVFPHTVNKIIKAQLKNLGGECSGEEYLPLGADDFSETIKEIKNSKPDVIINTLNGDSNISFFKQFSEEGFSADNLPVMSFSIAEGEVQSIGGEYLEGQLVAWNYFATTISDENEKFINDFKVESDGKMPGDPVEAAYIAVHMWAAACEKAGTFDVEAVRMASKGLSFAAPEGIVTIDGGNQHLCKKVRIGKIKNDGLIDEIWSTPTTIKPDPYLSTYAWARGL